MRFLEVDLTRRRGSRGCGHFFLSGSLRFCAWSVIFFIVFSATEAKDIKVGGEAGWTLVAEYVDIEASVEDRLLFDWEGNLQDVVALKKRSCALEGVTLAASTDSPAYVDLDYTGSFFFSSSLADHCSAGQLLAVSVSPNNKTTEKGQEKEDEEDEEDLEHSIRNGTGYCLDPVHDETDSALLRAVCFSPPMQLKPGQVEDALYFLPNPFPEDQLVGVTKQTLAIVDDKNREVPLSELYLHHIFGPSDLITGEGAEFRGNYDAAPLAHPYYTVINGSHFAPEMSRMVNIHVINTLGVAPVNVPKCIECWCSDEKHKLKGEHGGGSCCSEELCQSTEPSTKVNTYHLQFTVTYRLLEPSLPVVPVVSYMMDAANGSIEYDVVKQPGQNISTLSLSGSIDAMCPQSSSFGLLRCLGHQHIGGRCMRLIDQDRGIELCRSCPSYGTDDRDVPGNEQNYLVKMSEATMQTPLHIQPGTNVTIESDYDTSVDHFGVMALFFLDLVDFNKSCPGPITASTGSAFGPDYRHFKGTAFGFYADGFGAMSESGDPPDVDKAEDKGVDSRSVSVPEITVIILALLLFGSGGVYVMASSLRGRRYNLYSGLNLGPSDHTEAEADDGAQSQRNNGV